MRLAVVIALALWLAPVISAAGPPPVPDGRRHATDTELFIDVPLDYSTETVFPGGGSHHALPGTVSINRAPYFCVKHNLPFFDRSEFLIHLKGTHHVSDREITAGVAVHRGQQVLYVGD